MIFTATELAGVYEIEIEAVEDDRGWFARTFDRHEFERHGLELSVVHGNSSFNRRTGTLRGMHYQEEPHGEPKLVRCTRGAIFDAAVDVRRASRSYLGWHGTTLTADNSRMLYLPIGVAHGFQTLVDDCEVSYLMGHEHVPEAGRGVRWDDPAIGIVWPPAAKRIISERDATYPLIESR